MDCTCNFLKLWLTKTLVDEFLLVQVVNLTSLFFIDLLYEEWLLLVSLVNKINKIVGFQSYYINWAKCRAKAWYADISAVKRVWFQWSQPRSNYVQKKLEISFSTRVSHFTYKWIGLQVGITGYTEFGFLFISATYRLTCKISLHK